MAEKIEICFLGTSDSVPTAKRNHPAFLLTYKGENLLVDCGEGTQRQLRKARLNPCKINKILITHWHADHVLGLPGLIKTLALSGYNKTLEVYGPKNTKKFLKRLLDLFAFRNEFKVKVKEVSGKFYKGEDFYLEAEKMKHGTPCNAYNFILNDKIRIDKNKLKKHNVKPGKHLQELKEGKSIKYKGKKYKAKDLTFEEKGKKISFVMDTLNNKRIPGFVENADVFVCEGTFSSGEKAKAKEYKHMTAEQVAKAAKKANVGKTYLVHVSQRHSKNRKAVLEEAREVFKETNMPGDLDKITV